MNKMQQTFAQFVFILLQEFCFGLNQVSQRNIGYYYGENSGTFTGISAPIVSDGIFYYNLGAYNYATSTDNIANAGNRFFTSGDVDISDSEIIIYARAFNNQAQSEGNTAVGGSQTVIAEIADSQVLTNSDVSSNVAKITGTNTITSVPQAIAGQQTQVVSIENSLFVPENQVVNNVAVNQAGGNSLAGSESSFGNVDNSSIYLDDVVNQNYAYNTDGPATSGVKFGAQYIQNSNITLRTYSQRNGAFSIEAPAVAGVQQSFGYVSNANIDIKVDSIFNNATAKDNGTAISGLVSAFESVENSTVDFDVKAYNNYAYAYGDSDTPQDSVAGVSITVNSLENSNLNIQANTGDNYAFNNVSSNSNNNDAISGVDIVVGQGKDSQVNVDLSSKNNSAYAVYGDAVAGNRVQVLSSENTTVTYNNNNAAGNDGTSIFGSFIGK